MHYKDGTEAKLFDVVKFKPHSNSPEFTGVLVNITPQSSSCNGEVQRLMPEICMKYSSHQPPVFDHGFTKTVKDTITLGDAELVYRDSAVV